MSYVNQRNMALIAIAVVIPAAMIWVLYSDGYPGTSKPDETSAPNVDANPSSIKVVASFFPLYDFAKHVAGEKANVTSVIPNGIEPHDWEPTAQQVLQLQSADLFIYNGAGMDNWANKVEAKIKVNASEGLALLTENKGNPNAHTWLDPVMAMRQVGLIRNGLIKADPQNTEYYSQNAETYINQLQELDEKIKSELSSCAKSDFIAFHSAFSYFSARYGLKQHTISGDNPEGEIRPQTLSELVTFAREYDINVVYSEELVDPRNAQVIANEIPNGKVLVLSPIEGIEAEEQAQGTGYLEKMQENLENLKQGLDCK